jgi:hypothetical protein
MLLTLLRVSVARAETWYVLVPDEKVAFVARSLYGVRACTRPLRRVTRDSDGSDVLRFMPFEWDRWRPDSAFAHKR